MYEACRIDTTDETNLLSSGEEHFQINLFMPQK